MSDGVPEGPYATLAAAQSAGTLTVNYGVFANAIMSFLIVAFVLGEIRDLLKART